MSSAGTGSGDLHHDPAYFEAMYRADDDPWGFESRWYEQRKYDVTMALLPRPRYRHGIEPGCANGALTARLAARCDRVTAFDFIDDAVDRAVRRLADHQNVAVGRGIFPHYWPTDPADLVVWSEIGYYLGAAGRALAERGLRRWLEPNGHLLAVHYTGETDYPATGREVTRWIDDFPWLEPVATLEDRSFEAGVWVRTETDSSDPAAGDDNTPGP